LLLWLGPLTNRLIRTTMQPCTHYPLWERGCGFLRDSPIFSQGTVSWNHRSLAEARDPTSTSYSYGTGLSTWLDLTGWCSWQGPLFWYLWYGPSSYSV